MARNIMIVFFPLPNLSLTVLKVSEMLEIFIFGGECRMTVKLEKYPSLISTLIKILHIGRPTLWALRRLLLNVNKLTAVVFLFYFLPFNSFAHAALMRL